LRRTAILQIRPVRNTHRIIRRREREAQVGKQADRDFPKRFGALPKTGKYLSQQILDLAKLPAPEQSNRAREMIVAIRTDPQHPFSLPRDPRHAGAADEMQKLYQAQYYESGEPVLAKEK
jgi:hypothetical protein